MTGFELIQEENPVGQLTFLHIQAVNAKGEPVYAKIDDLHIELDGEAELLGFGSFEAPYNSGYDKPDIQIVNGTALAILKKAADAEVKATVSGAGVAGEIVLK